VDFEFRSEGDRPEVHCIAAVEARTGRTVNLWRDQLGPRPPFAVDNDTLIVAFYASAEIGCFLSLGWPLPLHVLDLYAEFRNLTNGLDTPFGRGLTGAADAFRVPHMERADKEVMQALARRGGPYTTTEKRDLLAYCLEDARLLVALLPPMLPRILDRFDRDPKTNLFHALIRGRYMRACARMEWVGVPIAVPLLRRLQAHWSDIQENLVEEIDPAFGVYEGRTFKEAKFRAYLERERIPWPLLESGHLDLKRQTFKDMAKAYPRLHPLKELRSTLSELRLHDLAIGRDGRNRTLLGAFGARSGRNAPKAGEFVFGPAVWIRALIVPPPGYAIAYIDWSAQEVGIAAALSGDPALIQDYLTDPYLGFAKRIGLAPPEATKRTHGTIRDAMKPVVLGVNYGMGLRTMASRLGKDTDETARLIAGHRRAYPRFWRWVDAAVDYAQLRGRLETRLGWCRFMNAEDFRPTSAQNSPMQATGSDMLRLGTIYATEAGLDIAAPVHDAVMLLAPERWIEPAVREAQKHMRRASADLLDGFEIRTSATIVRSGKHYIDPRGLVMWRRVMAQLKRIETATRGAMSCA
jgi:hypothetical protein